MIAVGGTMVIIAWVILKLFGDPWVPELLPAEKLALGIGGIGLLLTFIGLFIALWTYLP